MGIIRLLFLIHMLTIWMADGSNTTAYESFSDRFGTDLNELLESSDLAVCLDHAKKHPYLVTTKFEMELELWIERLNDLVKSKQVWTNTIAFISSPAAKGTQEFYDELANSCKFSLEAIKSDENFSRYLSEIVCVDKSYVSRILRDLGGSKQLSCIRALHDLTKYIKVQYQVVVAVRTGRIANSKCLSCEVSQQTDTIISDLEKFHDVILKYGSELQDLVDDARFQAKRLYPIHQKIKDLELQINNIRLDYQGKTVDYNISDILVQIAALENKTNDQRNDVIKEPADGMNVLQSLANQIQQINNSIHKNIDKNDDSFITGSETSSSHRPLLHLFPICFVFLSFLR